MEVSQAVLDLLEEGREAVSGEEIARRLGVSRNAVWKAVCRLREEGYGIDAASRRGYRLTSDRNVLSAGNIRRHLVGRAQHATLDVRETVTSTNTVLKELAERGGAEGAVCIAQQQTGGRGRLGRSFYSPKGTGLYMSVLLRPDCSAEEALSITTAAAVAVAQAVEAVTGREARIKWVNDVYVDGYKICGILTEAALDFENQGIHYAVLGIGVNIQEPAGGFRPDLRGIAGALYGPGDAVPAGCRARLAAEILNRFFGFYGELSARSFLEEYQRRSLLTGLDVTFVQGEETHRGTVLGVDDAARLRVRLPSGEEIFLSAGEVQIEKDFLARLRAKAKEI